MMEVPTYTAQQTMPRRGAGDFLNAQIDPRTLAAPHIAFAEAGQQMAQVGDKLIEWGLKKAQIAAESEAAAAVAGLRTDIAKQATAASLLPIGESEAFFAEKVADLRATYLGSMTSDAARAAFAAGAAPHVTSATIAFMKDNNERVIETAGVTVRKTVENLSETALNLNLDLWQREAAVKSAVEEIVDAAAQLGPKAAEEMHDAFWRNLAENLMAQDLNLRGAGEAGSIAAAWRSGDISDPVAKLARENLTDSEIFEMAQDLDKLAAQEATRATAEADRIEDENEALGRELWQRLALDPGSFGTPEEINKAFEALAGMNVLMPDQLVRLDKHLSGGPTVDRRDDVLKVHRVLAASFTKAGEEMPSAVRTPAELLDLIDAEGLEIGADTKMELLKMMETLTRRENAAAIEYGLNLLGYMESGSGDWLIDAQGAATPETAMLFQTRMFDWIRENPGANPLPEAKRVAEELGEAVSQASVILVHRMRTAYLNAVENNSGSEGDLVNIERQRESLKLEMFKLGWISHIELLNKNHDPEDYFTSLFEDAGVAGDEDN